jgi:hypothetical protein
MYVKVLALIGIVLLGLAAPVVTLIYTTGWSDGVRYQKERVTCPPGTYVSGVRPDGTSMCVTAPPPGCDEPAGTAREQLPCHYDEKRVPFKIYCTGGTRPIVVDAHTVGCQR